MCSVEVYTNSGKARLFRTLVAVSHYITAHRSEPTYAGRMQETPWLTISDVYTMKTVKIIQLGLGTKNSLKASKLKTHPFALAMT